MVITVMRPCVLYTESLKKDRKYLKITVISLFCQMKSGFSAFMDKDDFDKRVFIQVLNHEIRILV
jgi:hypothetical protein